MEDPTTTILRVKRSRHVNPPAKLSFQGQKRKRKNAGENEEALESQSPSDVAFVWKHAGYVTSISPSKLSKNKRNKRSIVDAVLEDERDETGEAAASSKRRRLALKIIPSPTASSKRRGIRVLSPNARFVESSLMLVEQGSKMVSEHMDMIEQDSHLCFQPDKWVAFQLNGSGNSILHLATLWNDVESTRRICLQYGGKRGILDQSNADELRPYQLATQTGHYGCAEVLEAFGADTTDFVYDVYHLQTRAEDVSNGHEDQETKDGDDFEATEVDLRGGFGYFDPQGRLVVETVFDDDDDASKEDNGAAMGEDADSNAESFEGNDYPDEEDFDSEEFVDGYTEDENDIYERQTTPAVFGPGSVREFLGQYGGELAAFSNAEEYSDG